MEGIEAWCFKHKNCGGQLETSPTWTCLQCGEHFDVDKPPIVWYRKIAVYVFAFVGFGIIMPIQYAIWRWQDRKK